jgi:hypothetical protein
MYEVTPAGSEYAVTDAAWAGNAQVMEIEQSAGYGDRTID